MKVEPTQPRDAREGVEVGLLHVPKIEVLDDASDALVVAHESSLRLRQASSHPILAERHGSEKKCRTRVAVVRQGAIIQPGG
jgi:hypothetical protein